MITPASPASDAPSTNALTLSRNVLTPIAAAAVSSSRIATHARPTRLLLARTKTSTTNARSSELEEVVVREVAELEPEEVEVLAEVPAEELQRRDVGDAVRAVRDVRPGPGAAEVVHRDPEDLTEPERDDREVVARVFGSRERR